MASEITGDFLLFSSLKNHGEHRGHREKATLCALCVLCGSGIIFQEEIEKSENCIEKYIDIANNITIRCQK